ncbi:carboxylate-amine ligase [Actinokineospora sp. HUAS TT18]|uniref:carboxylate-amine ligase n=1 Tax=Actinokineospora sp. HUAS TT18 TaxID=3447451 RepID=UPI003F527B38
MTVTASTPPTIGVEEEFLLVDPTTGLPVPRAPEVVEYARNTFGVELGLELALAQVEIRTGVCRDLSDAREQLHDLRKVATAAAEAVGCRALAVGVPVVGGTRIETAPEGRYGQLTADYRQLAAEQSICGCHVHVAVPDPETAVRVCNHLRPWLPVLGLLTANSPIAAGRDTGYASWRTIVWSRWPSSGPPPYFESAAHHGRTIEMLQESGAAGDARMVYWDVRPSAHLPTVEVRVADVAGTVEEAVLLAALVRGLVATALTDLRRGVLAPRIPVETLKVATWRAARDGLTGDAFDVLSGRLIPARALVDRLVDHAGDALAQMGDLDTVAELLADLDRTGTGAMRQRAAFARTGRITDVLAQCDAACSGGPVKHTA